MLLYELLCWHKQGLKEELNCWAGCTEEFKNLKVLAQYIISLFHGQGDPTVCSDHWLKHYVSFPLLSIFPCVKILIKKF